MKLEINQPNDDIYVVAVVKFNDREALVLNRPISFIYEPNGMGFIGKDGPFRTALKYEHGSGSWVAFGGAKFSIKMIDGSVKELQNHWWSTGLAGCVPANVETVVELKKCYVFHGMMCLESEYKALREKYTGAVYPYWDYEKVIKFDDMRKDLYRKLWREEKKVKAVIQEAKKHKNELKAIASLGKKSHYAIIKEAFSKCDIEIEEFKRHDNGLPYMRFPDNLVEIDSDYCAGGKREVFIHFDFDFNADGSFMQIDGGY